MRLLVVLLVLGGLFVVARLAVPRLSQSAARGPVERGDLIERDGTHGAEETGDGASDERLRRLADCPDSPNCQGSDSSRESQRVEPFPMHGSVERTMADLVGLLEAQSGATVIAREPHYLHATFTTPLMGYVDDVEFLVDPASESVRVRSASRLGHSDLGANAKRLAALREIWTRD